jgi:hypothetical protein
MEHPDVVVEEHAERALRDVPPPPAPLDAITGRLHHSGGAAVYSIDRINDRPPGPNETIVAHGELKIAGWAIDKSAGQPASGVEIVIDGIPLPAAYGIEHPRAAELSGCGSCRNSGFLADLSVAGLLPGSHTIAIRVVSAHGDSYTERLWGGFRIVKT